MKCNKCGAEIKEGNTFCTNCGTKVNDEKNMNGATSREDKIYLTVVGIVGLIMAVIILKKQGIL